MKKAAVALALIALALGLAACGGGSSSSSTTEETPAPAESSGGAQGGGAEAEGGTAGSGAQIDFEANPEGMLQFEEKSATAKGGEDTIDITNPSSVPHNVSIEDSAGKTIAETETVTEGSSSAVADLKPGTYTFYCSIPGHRQAGMEGTLTVK
jgi:plastocyanin